MEYNFSDIERKWQKIWKETNTYKVAVDPSRPKCYVLDMFPYPSGAGLHVGHPLGYIASDIYSRFKRLKGFNVLHPMGFDSFGLPAEQYALETGQHPAVTTEKNIATFKSQLDKIGFCYDWSREVRTSDPSYYKWTQWIFLQLFNSWYNRETKRAEPISTLIPKLKDFDKLSEKEQADLLMNYRLAYCGYGEVNWCEALGTVLANDEVVNGVSERGGHPVVKKKLRQWYLRITEYADRLLEGLERVEFSEAMKDMQTNWIGKSSGAEIDFRLTPRPPLLTERGGLILEESSTVGEEKADFDKKESGHYFQTANTFYWKILKEYGRDNRKNPTKAEDVLWQRLRNNQLNYKVRRQHAIEGYIVDFVFIEVKLVIEVDGEYHGELSQREYDEARSAYLKEFGFNIIRFTNDEVIENTDKVIEKIKAEIKKRKNDPQSTTPPQSSIRTLKIEAPPLREERGLGGEATLRVYTTRPDTIFGVDFMVIAPEHELVTKITTPEQKQAVEEYITYVKSRSERERIAEKKITGAFTGTYAINPFNGRKIPIWISEYVLAGYGTGAIMAVPCADERDFKFAKHFGISITNIIGNAFNGEEANSDKSAVLDNSDFLNGLDMVSAAEIALNKLEELGIGKRKVNYKMRDAAFSRQRYWGEPFPITWKDGIAAEWKGNLPLELPYVETYGPGPDAQGPLANIPGWVAQELETNTMPGYAGSSWYFLRYMDPQNDMVFCDRKASDYWQQVDLYIGGTEHAVGHLLYSRMWTKVLYDLGMIGFDEPFKKLLNQGMIQGSSRFVYRISDDKIIDLVEGKVSQKRIQIFVSYNIYTELESIKNIEGIIMQLEKYIPGHPIIDSVKEDYGITFSKFHVDVNIVDGIELDIEEFRKWKNGEYIDAEFILEEGKYICGMEVEKMSKSKYNTVNPDNLVSKYGADTFRMYEMFLGPVEQSKPWDTKGIEGVHRFLKKLWRLFDVVESGAPTSEELKILHKTIKKIEEDTERFSFNTAVSTFMICINELADLKCNKKEILEQVLILLTPYAPHISEELWNKLGNAGSILNATYPTFEEKYVTESSKEYPVSINGRLRTNINISMDAAQEQVEQIVLTNETVQKWLEGNQPKKIIFVKGKMINVVI